MRAIFDFREGENVVFGVPNTTEKRRRLYASLGIFKGASATVFLISGKKVILAVGGSKFALSQEAARDLLAEKA